MLELAQKYYHLPSDTVAKILGTTTSAPPTPARSTPSPRSTRPCSPASSTRPARSSRRRRNCTWTTSRCRPRSTSPAPRWRDQYETATVRSGQRDQERLAAGHRHHDHRHADPGRRWRSSPTRCRRPAWPSTSREGSRCSPRRWSAARAPCPRASPVSWAASPQAAASGGVVRDAERRSRAARQGPGGRAPAPVRYPLSSPSPGRRSSGSPCSAR